MKHVLIVEDDRDLSELWKLSIDRMDMPGVSSEVRRDGRSAMQRVQAPPPSDVIILDLHLPFVEGTEIYDFVRSAKHLKNSRIIIITADRELAEEFTQKAQSGEIIPPDGVVIKPVLVKEFHFKNLSKRHWAGSPDWPRAECGCS